jgi:hypothetical protein
MLANRKSENHHGSISVPRDSEPFLIDVDANDVGRTLSDKPLDNASCSAAYLKRRIARHKRTHNVPIRVDRSGSEIIEVGGSERGFHSNSARQRHKVGLG